MHKIRNILLFIFVLIGTSSATNTIKKVHVYEDMYASIAYPKNDYFVTEGNCSDLDSTHILYCKADGDENYLFDYFITNENSRFQIFFSQGASVDPHYVFVKNNKVVGRYLGLDLKVKNDSLFYLNGHTNSWFNIHQKLVLENDSIVELKQPFYGVEIVTKTKKPISLYGDENHTIQLAYLPSNYPIEIVVAKCEDRSKCNFLIKSKLGLVGWYRPKFGEYEIDGLFYFGD